jgi:hypothetical protein
MDAVVTVEHRRASCTVWCFLVCLATLLGSLLGWCFLVNLATLLGPMNAEPCFTITEP